MSIWLVLICKILINISAQLTQDGSGSPNLSEERVLKEMSYKNLQEAQEDTTLVSAFWDIGRGNWDHLSRSVDEYFKNAERVLSAKNKMVIFTDPFLAERVRNLRRANDPNLKRTTVIERSLEQMPYYQYKDRVIRIMNDARYRVKIGKWITDPEYSNAVYDITMFSKFSAMEETIVQQYQPSTYYIWVDFSLIPEIFLPNFTNTYLPKNDLVFRNNKKFRIGGFPNYILLQNKTLDQIFESHEERLCGGIFGGHEQGVLQACAIFKRALEDCLYQNFVSDDQDILGWAFIKSSGLFDVHNITQWAQIVSNF